MDNINKYCSKEKIQRIKVGLEKTLEILRQAGTGNPAIAGQQLRNLFKSMDTACLAILEVDLQFDLDRLSEFMARGSGGRMVREAKDRVIPRIENLLPRLDDIAANLNSEPSQSQSASSTPIMLFPGNKYLNLSTADEFPDVKTKYRELSLVYHPDKCPNDKTPGFTKEQCEDEFKILNNEYNAIKEKLGVSGGKRRKRKNKTKKGKKSRRHVAKSKRRYRR